MQYEAGPAETHLFLHKVIGVAILLLHLYNCLGISQYVPSILPTQLIESAKTMNTANKIMIDLIIN